MTSTATRGFYKLCLSTLVAVYFLILVGGIVRTTGSGMGCPDWPRCFGQWVPPSSVEQLPDNYKEEFAAFREKKNQKFAKYLSALGMKETADKILNDKSILEEADFNPTKTKIEYINRLVGVVIGFMIIALFVRSIRYRRQAPFYFWMSLLTLITVIVQGWFGSIVVSTNLTSWTITLHMFLALVLVAMLISLVYRAGAFPAIAAAPYVKIVLAACMLLLMVQVFFGTELRSAIDRVSDARFPRGEWIAQAWNEFVVHRSFSWLVALFHAILIARLWKTSGPNPLTLSLIVLILLTVLTGAGMGYFSVPAFLQPVHLLVATITFGLQFILFLRLDTRLVKRVEKI